MRKITRCRACGSAALAPAFTLQGPPAKTKGVLARKAGDVAFVLCDPTEDAGACGLLQNAFTTEAGEARVTASGVYRSVRSSLRSMATEGLELISGRDCAALDIGCSDGTLLSFYPRWVDRYGIDPASEVEQIGGWAWSARAQFPSPDLDRAFAGKKFDLITAASVLEEIEEPRAFFARVKGLLAGDGVFVLETRYAPMALTGATATAFAGTVAGVYSLGVLERILRDCELKIFRGALTDKAGGSIRLFVTHDRADDYDFDPWYERLARLWDEENALALRAHQPYQAFERRARAAQEAFEQAMTEFAERGATAHLASADAAASMLLTWAGQGARAIEAAIGSGDIESGARLQSGGPPIVPESESRLAAPDYLIVPAGLKKEMLERCREQILHGMKLVLATPHTHLVHQGNYAAEFAKSLAGAGGGDGTETLRAILSAAGAPRVIAGRDWRQSA